MSLCLPVISFFCYSWIMKKKINWIAVAGVVFVVLMIAAALQSRYGESCNPGYDDNCEEEPILLRP